MEKDHRWYGYENLALANWDEQQRVLAPHLDAESWELVSLSRP